MFMKKALFVLVALFVFCMGSAVAQKVYVTKSGNKYHTKDCTHAKGGEAILLKDAQTKKYTACGTCKADAAVYVTASGKSYHTKDCTHAKDGEAMTPAEAKKNNKPCAKCKPDGGK